MFDQPPPDLIDTATPAKGIILCAVGMCLSFGLCGVTLGVGTSSLTVVAVVGFAMSLLGILICLIWLMVAAIVNASQGLDR